MNRIRSLLTLSSGQLDRVECQNIKVSTSGYMIYGYTVSTEIENTLDSSYGKSWCPNQMQSSLTGEGKSITTESHDSIRGKNSTS